MEECLNHEIGHNQGYLKLTNVGSQVSVPSKKVGMSLMLNKRAQDALLRSHKEPIMWFCIVSKDFTNSSNLRENEQIQFDQNESVLIAADKPLALVAVNCEVASKRKTDLTYALYRIKGS